MCLSKADVLGPATAVTALEALLGFAVGAGLALAIAIACSFVPYLEDLVYPYAVALKAIPVVAVAPLLILWFGNGLASKVVMAALICFFPVLVNASTGFRDLPDEGLELFRTLSASRRQVMWHLRLPSAMPYIFASFKVAASLAVVGAIVGELAGSDRGIGFIIQVSSYRLDTPLLFAALGYCAALGLLLYAAVSWCAKAVLERLRLSSVTGTEGGR